MAYGDFKGVSRRITYDKVLRDKVINIAKIQNMMMNIKEVSLQLFINLSIKSLEEMLLKMKLCQTNN